MNQNQVYDEESQIEDLNVEADRVIAMNPSGVIENFESNGKKISCDGNKCVVLGNDEDCANGICENKIVTSTSYSTYIIYFVIFLVICALAYFAYKKYSGCSA
jgi:hypothetical protein